MNIKLVFKMTGFTMMLAAVLMVLPVIVALIYQERSGIYFLPVMASVFLVGFLFYRLKTKREDLYAADGFAIVTFSWGILSLTGALPFYLSRQIPSFIDSFFETVSGFTTTGASVLADVESLDKCMLFWRSFTHFIGGMGVLVFVLAIAKFSGGQSLHILRAESPGPTVEKIFPRMNSTAKMLYTIYIGLTSIQVILLCSFGMPFFDALLTAFGTAGTGGFAIKNAGIGAYSAACQTIITIFMFLFGMNFNFYVLLLLRKYKQAFLEEIRWYLVILASAAVIVTINISQYFESIWEAFHHAAFQTASIMSSTGFATTDFNSWPDLSRYILVLLMFIGACAGSTGGGFKVSRLIILLKSYLSEIAALVHSGNVRTIRLNGKKVDNETVRRTAMFFFGFIAILTISSALLCFDRFGLTENFTASLSAVSNIGPALGIFGPMGNYGAFSPFSKLVLIFDMLLGRLEFFPIIVLFHKKSWKQI